MAVVLLHGGVAKPQQDSVEDRLRCRANPRCRSSRRPLRRAFFVAREGYTVGVGGMSTRLSVVVALLRNKPMPNVVVAVVGRTRSGGGCAVAGRTALVAFVRTSL